MSNADKSNTSNLYWALTRIALGFIFLWAFLDKLFGLGFATKPEKSWLSGASPAAGFLKNGVHGPLADFYQSLSGNPLVDWLFMLGLLGLGVSLILGIGMKIAGYLGSLLMLLMWSSLLPPENNPIVDEHIVYMFVLLGLAHSNAGNYMGLGRKWSETNLVKNWPILR